jgi:hypothetical protein
METNCETARRNLSLAERFDPSRVGPATGSDVSRRSALAFGCGLNDKRPRRFTTLSILRPTGGRQAECGSISSNRAMGDKIRE